MPTASDPELDIYDTIVTGYEIFVSQVFDNVKLLLNGAFLSLPWPSGNGNEKSICAIHVHLWLDRLGLEQSLVWFRVFSWFRF